MIVSNTVRTVLVFVLGIIQITNVILLERDLVAHRILKARHVT
jgi:hypothetical protein